MPFVQDAEILKRIPWASARVRLNFGNAYYRTVLRLKPGMTLVRASAQIDAAIRSALRETVFRFDLVMRILVTTHELLEREALIDAALSAHLALLTSEGRAARRRDATYPERFARLRDLLLFRVAELRAAQEARSAVETRYLAGHTALFPDEVTAWEEQVTSTKTIVDVACRLAELDGVPPAEPADPDAAAAHVTELVADLVEPAKTTALEKLDEGRQAFATG